MRALVWVIGIIVLVGVIVRVIADPIAAHYTRQALDGVPDTRGTFADVHVRFLPPGLEISRLKIVEHPKGDWDEPLLYIEHGLVTVHWRELLRGHLVGRVRLTEPKVLAVRRPEEKAEKATDLAGTLEQILPLRIDRFEITDGEVLIAPGGPKGPRIWIHELDLVATDLATRKALLEGERSRLEADARVQKSGKLKLAFAMDPFAKALTFTGNASLRNLDARELHALLKPGGITISKGQIDLFADLRARDGRITGGAKPLFKGVELAAADDGLGNRIKAAFANLAVEILDDDKPRRDAVATVVPIEGKVKNPEAQLVPTILGVVRNAFVQAITEGFTNLPPPKAEEKQGIIKQTVDALQKDEGPPKAQPQQQGRAGKSRR